MVKLTFSQKEIAEKTAAVVLLRYYSVDRERVYAYVMAKLSNLIKFKEDIKAKKDFKLENYGKVIQWGYGDPPPEIMQKMKDEYQFDHQSGIIIDDGPTVYEKEQAAKAASGAANSEEE